MTGTLVVVSEAVSVVTDVDNRFVKLDELAGTAGPAVRSRVRGSRSENGMQRILREDMFDVGDEQFLMLLLVMNPENQERLNFAKQIFVRAPDQTHDLFIDRTTIRLRFIDRCSGTESAQIATMHIARS